MFVMKKILLILLFTLLTQVIYSQNDAGYYAVSIGHNRYSQQEQKTIFFTKPDLIPIPNEVVKTDIKKQFFYFLYKNYPNVFKRFKYSGKGQPDHSFSSLTIFFSRTKEDALSKVTRYYGINSTSLKKDGFDVYFIEDFTYQKDTYTSKNYSSKQLWEQVKSIQNYFRKGIEISSN